jgi:kynurenine formamidase
MRVVDLSMTIQPIWRWPCEIETAGDFARGDPFRFTFLRIGMHAFTHVDTPLHIEAGRESVDIVALDRLCGTAAVVSLTPVTPGQEIGRDLLISRATHILPGDIVLLKTGWDLARSAATREYWTEAPYLSSEAARWLSEQPLKAVGFDFPQDFAIREIPARHPSVQELPTHDLILRKGILMIEYLANLSRISLPRVEVYALPLKVAGGDGGCARVIAVER